MVSRYRNDPCKSRIRAKSVFGLQINLPYVDEALTETESEDRLDALDKGNNVFGSSIALG